ncbi:MAG TPA: Gfo/Idh/MocA family oxidoreductase [Bacillota bacterium]|nr:Gfo/Idh/MocA family oxidoreductase [Bacillota bacterium]
MRFGVIGCGTVAEWGHLPAIAALPEAELVAVADLDIQRAERLGRRFGADLIFQDYRELLACPEIEAVVVATPVETHHQIVMAAAQQKKHVLCEKPIAPSLAQGREMIQAMNEAGCYLGINFLLRESEPLVSIKRYIDKGLVGKLKVLRLIFNSPGPGWAGKERLDNLMTHGLGPIFDCGVHYFDLARWFTGREFLEVEARGAFIDEYQNPLHVIATCRLEDEIMVMIEESWLYTHGAQEGNRYRRYDIIGDEGTISYSTDTEELVLYREDGTTRLYIAKEQKAFDRIYINFIESVKNHEQNGLISGEDGLRAVEAALRAVESARRKKQPHKLAQVI